MTDRHCEHLLTNPSQPQAVIREAGVVTHHCAVCTAQRLTMILEEGIAAPAKVVWMVNLKECPHYRAGSQCCLPCWRGVAGAMLLMWSSTRVQTYESTQGANRLMRLLHFLIRQFGHLDALVSLQPGKSSDGRRQREKAVLNNGRETRG